MNTGPGLPVYPLSTSASKSARGMGAVTCAVVLQMSSTMSMPQIS